MGRGHRWLATRNRPPGVRCLQVSHPIRQRHSAANLGSAKNSKKPHSVQRDTPIGIPLPGPVFVPIQNDFCGGPSCHCPTRMLECAIRDKASHHFASTFRAASIAHDAIPSGYQRVAASHHGTGICSGFYAPRDGCPERKVCDQAKRADSARTQPMIAALRGRDRNRADAACRFSEGRDPGFSKPFPPGVCSSDRGVSVPQTIAPCPVSS